MTNKENRKLFWGTFNKLHYHRDLHFQSNLIDMVMFGPDINDYKFEEEILAVMNGEASIEDLSDNTFDKLKEMVLLDVLEMIKTNERVLDCEQANLDRRKDTLNLLRKFKEKHWEKYRIYIEDIVEEVNNQNNYDKEILVKILDYFNGYNVRGLKNNDKDSHVLRCTIGYKNMGIKNKSEITFCVDLKLKRLELELLTNKGAIYPSFVLYEDKEKVINKIKDVLLKEYKTTGGQK